MIEEQQQKVELSHIKAKRPFLKETIETPFTWASQLASQLWLTHCQGATEGADGQVAFMRQLHESSFSGAQFSQRRLRVAEQSSPTSSSELIHGGHAWHCETASVCSATYFQHIYQLPLYATLYSVLALCMNSINNPAGLSLRVSGLALLGTNVIPSPPHPPATWRQQWSNTGINDFSFADEYASLLIS